MKNGWIIDASQTLLAFGASAATLFLAPDGNRRAPVIDITPVRASSIARAHGRENTP